MLNPKQVYWRTRRGMLELDIFLQPFFNDCYADLSLDDKQAFVALLNEADPDIYNWLMGNSISKDSQQVRICGLIREHNEKADSK